MDGKCGENLQNIAKPTKKARTRSGMDWSSFEVWVSGCHRVAWTKVDLLKKTATSEEYLAPENRLRLPPIPGASSRTLGSDRTQSSDTRWSGGTNVTREETQRKLLCAKNMLQHIFWEALTHSHIYYRQMQVFKMMVAANSNWNTLHSESHNMTAATMFDQFDLDVFS